MASPTVRHPSNHELESYLLNRLSAEDTRVIEEHYLSCPGCVGRISQAAEVLSAIDGEPLRARLIRKRPATITIDRVGAVVPAGRTTSPVSWIALAGVVALAATGFYYRGIPAAGPPLPPRVITVVPDLPAVQPALVPAPVRRKARRSRFIAAHRGRDTRPKAPGAPQKIFEPPPSTRVAKASIVPRLEMPNLKIDLPAAKAPYIATAAPAVPQFKPKRNRLVRALSAIGRYLKSAPPDPS